MTTAADTVEIIGLFDRLDEVSKSLVFEIIRAMSRGHLSCDEVGAATDRILAGADKIETLEDLVQLSNERLTEAAAGEVTK
jgi:hypothetical protein